MRTMIKVLIVLFGLGFVGSILNETPNYYLAGSIVVLGVFYVLYDHYRPLEVKKKHKEVILLIVFEVLKESYNHERAVLLIEKLMIQIQYRNNIGDSTIDTCDRLKEDLAYLMNQYANFDAEQRKYMKNTIQLFLNQNNLTGEINLESINHFLKTNSQELLH